MKRRKEYDDDDGRVIANMDVEGMPYHQHRAPKSDTSEQWQTGHSQTENGAYPDRMREEKIDPLELSKGERTFAVLGALKAALLIALVFIVGLGLAILAMILLWT